MGLQGGGKAVQRKPQIHLTLGSCCSGLRWGDPSPPACYAISHWERPSTPPPCHWHIHRGALPRRRWPGNTALIWACRCLSLPSSVSHSSLPSQFIPTHYVHLFLHQYFLFQTRSPFLNLPLLSTPAASSSPSTVYYPLSPSPPLSLPFLISSASPSLLHRSLQDSARSS